MESFYLRLGALDDLANMWLPAIRDSMNAAATEIRLANEHVEQAFTVDGHGVYHLFQQPGQESYVTLDFMRRVFQDNSENVDLAAQAVREIALRYRQADGQA